MRQILHAIKGWSTITCLMQDYKCRHSILSDLLPQAPKRLRLPCLGEAQFLFQILTALGIHVLGSSSVLCRERHANHSRSPHLIITHLFHSVYERLCVENCDWLLIPRLYTLPACTCSKTDNSTCALLYRSKWFAYEVMQYEWLFS